MSCLGIRRSKKANTITHKNRDITRCSKHNKAREELFLSTFQQSGWGRNCINGLGRLLNKLRMPLSLSFSLTLCFSSALQAQFLDADLSTGGLRINQIGYATNEAKIAILDSYIFPGQHDIPFYLIALNQFADTVFSGRLQQTLPDKYSGKTNYLADFSDFTSAGHYYLSIPGQGTSYPFFIQPHPFNSVLKGAIKAYYYNRASTVLSPEFAGPFARVGGHPDSIIYIHPSAKSSNRPSGSIISAPGGWYDAGDYNKYIVNSAVTVNTLLSALNQYPALLDTLTLAIPESTDQLPDLLNEILYNLRWMLKMQDPEDGGVYHKLTSAHFDKMEMPQRDHNKRYVIQKTTAAALDFAASMAMAARTMAKFNTSLPGLIDSLNRAALKAWNWAQANPHIIYNQKVLNKKYRPKINTGTYADTQLTDEWYQAASSLLLSTKNKTFLPFVQKYAPDSIVTPCWNNVAAIGAIWLSEVNIRQFTPSEDWSELNRQALSAVRKKATDAIMYLADQLMKHTNPGFHTVMGGRTTDFKWGSNSEAANQGWILMTAYRITHENKYRSAALANLDYLLGRNATGFCFVTGFGDYPPMHPHHRISTSDEVQDPIPGMLVGGPNPGRQDGVKGYTSDLADLSYIDNEDAYSVNEVAINWNAPFVYLLAAIEATENTQKNN